MTRATGSAVHEAAHAVTAVALGERVDFVTRHGRGATVGATVMPRPQDPDVDAIVALSGPWAESRHTGRPLFEWMPGWTSGMSDLARAQSCVPAGHDAADWLALRAEVAEHLLDGHWDEVLEVAGRLDRGPLTGKRVRAILHGERPPWPRPAWATELLQRAGYTPGGIERFVAPATMEVIREGQPIAP